MMFWLFNDSRPWFRPKSFGFGSGLPIAWQGWAFMSLHGLLATGLVLLLKDRPIALIAAILPVVILPMPIYAARTEGGWRWRWRWGGGE